MSVVTTGRRPIDRLPLLGWWSNTSLRTGILIIAVLTTFSIVAKFTLINPTKQALRDSYDPPLSPNHLLGADPLGRDILAWCAAGVLTALIVSLFVVIISMLIGVTVGLVSGYSRSAVDNSLMRLTELNLAVPPLVLFIAASAVITGSFLTVIVLLSIVSWVPYARLVRARVLVERERGYIAAARLAGTRTWRIQVFHLLPAAATEVLVLASLQAGTILLVEAGLSFLGLGLQPPFTSLGFMISVGRSDPLGSWWVIAFPGLMVMFLVLAFNLIGDGLRDLLRADVELGR
ncbi:MAG: ABC transporter permease [Chloroflexota bacterium]